MKAPPHNRRDGTFARFAGAVSSFLSFAGLLVVGLLRLVLSLAGIEADFEGQGGRGAPPSDPSPKTHRRADRRSSPSIEWWQALTVFSLLLPLMIGFLAIVAGITAAALAAMIQLRLPNLGTGGIGVMAACLTVGFAFIAQRGRDKVTGRTSTGASWGTLGVVLFGSASAAVLLAALLAKL